MANKKNPDWRTTPDGFRMEVPVAWAIEGAGAVPTTPNRDGLEGALEGRSAKISEIVVGTELPVPLFRASGVTKSGTKTGLSVGVYDLGSAVTVSTLNQQLVGAELGLSVKPQVFAGDNGLWVTQSNATPDSTGKTRVSCEYWASIPHLPTQVVVARFWNDDTGDDPELSSLQRRIADSFAFLFPASFSGGQRPFTLSLYAPSDPDDKTQDGWRLAGWRLGEPYRSKVLTANQAAAASHVPRQTEIRMVALAYVPWVIAILALVGIDEGKGILILGTLSALGAIASAQKLKWRAAAALAVVLVVLLGVGLASK
jgi:hypothetical protein